MYQERRMPQVTRSIEINAPPSAVWHWLASEETLRRWISSNMQIDMRVGGDYRFLGPDERTWVSGKVLELEPHKCLILSWLEEGNGWSNPARLVIRLSPTASGTRVTLIHDGFEAIGVANVAEWVEDYERGADAHRILEKLASLVSAGHAQR
jgi:uncharacterized protein YndB with AHSA1/START domain